jgi:diguanylate cyclase (GGDEF)-like protein
MDAIEKAQIPHEQSPSLQRVSLSMGIACQKSFNEPSKVLINRVDNALYMAKRKGRNRLEINE